MELDYSNTHKELVILCKQGERDASHQLYQLYSKAMFNICYRMLNNESDAEDVLQNAFIDVFTRINSFRFESSIGAWIKRIVVNNCINFLKKRRMHFEVLEEKVSDQVYEIDHHIDYDVTHVKNAISQLPDGYRIVVSLYLLEGYDHKEIATILNVSEATSKSQYSRGKQKIRDMISSGQVGLN